MKDCIPHGHEPIKLRNCELYYLSGGWLTDEDIISHNRILKGDFPEIRGLESPNYFTKKNPFLNNPTKEFVRILYCDNHHWITSSGHSGFGNTDVYIYDSMARKSVNSFLGDQFEKMMVLPKIDPSIQISIQHTQIQKLSLCGYYACAFATAICLKIDLETIIFEEENLTAHWLSCIKDKKVSMYPHEVKIKDDTPHVMIMFPRVKTQVERSNLIFIN